MGGILGKLLNGCHPHPFSFEYAQSLRRTLQFAGRVSRATCRRHRHGEHANRTLVAMPEGRLIAFGLAHSDIPAHQLTASLRSEEAKLWIHEFEVRAQLSEDRPAILYPPWQHATDSGIGLLAEVLDFSCIVWRLQGAEACPIRVCGSLNVARS